MARMTSTRPQPTPRWLGAHVERLLAARGDSERVRRVFERSSVPMVMVDGERRHVHVNTAARLAVRRSLEELRRLRIDDLTPPHLLAEMEAAWGRLLESGCVAGHYEVASPPEAQLDIVYYALAGALTDLYLIAFAPADWPETELLLEGDATATEGATALTQREIEVLQLAAEGCSATGIADRLVLSPATVRTHFANIYQRLDVHERAAAVAKAMRLGLVV